MAMFVVLVAPRFIGLETAPAGFWIDESTPAAQAVCVAQTGRTADGEVRLFAPLQLKPQDGWITPVVLVTSSAWVKIAGPSVLGFRILAAIVGFAGLVAVGWAAYVLNGRRLNALTASGLLLTAPWLFHFSRVYWDPIFAFTLWAFTFALWAQWREKRTSKLVFAIGIVSGLTMITYAPFRLGVPLSLVVMFWPRRLSQESIKTIRIAVGGLLFGILPVLTVVRNEIFWDRSGDLAIWNGDYLRSQGKSIVDVPWILVENLARHLDPRFLFVDGDANLRHGSGFGGILSPAHGVALAAIAYVALKRQGRLELRIVGLVMAGFVPASLTWESLPHGVRSLIAAPPLLLASILGAEFLIKRFPGRRVVAMLTIVMMLFFVAYLQNYFGPYEQKSRDWFTASDVDHWRETGEWLRPNWPLGGQYFEMAEGGRKCSDFQP